MAGTAPNTLWLDGCIVLDNKGFIKTGPNLSAENLSATRWPLSRQPYLVETSLAGVSALGDVRGGSIKRVASTVGEGSIAISFVHRNSRIEREIECYYKRIDLHNFYNIFFYYIDLLCEENVLFKIFIEPFLSIRYNIPSQFFPCLQGFII